VPGEYDLNGAGVGGGVGYGHGVGSDVSGGSFQAGVGSGTITSQSVANLSLNGRNFMALTALAPGVALSRGQLGGYVLDSSGAVISNAHLEIQNIATHTTWSAETTEEGSWLILGLPSGMYQITASATGFQSARQHVSYDEANPSAYRISLNVGAATETVMVEAEAPVLNTTSSSVISLKDKKHKMAATPPPPPAASANVFNLQQRVAGVLPIAVDVPRAGTSYRFVRPLVVNEETKLAFTYKTK